jgi:LmbE family N-acetylglucosaminyl deacetylase
MSLVPNVKYLFLFAHPDDDVFIAGSMKLLLDSGAHVEAAWLTSGGMMGGAKHREKELHRAMEVLGLPSERIHLLRFPDLSLVEHLDSASDKLAELLGELKPDTVIATAYEGGHPDHDAVNFLAGEALTRSQIQAKRFEYPLYNGTGPIQHWWWRINRFPPNDPPTLHTPMTEESIRCKHRLMRIYSSQWMFMVPARLASGKAKLLRYGEPYRAVPLDRDYLSPPHTGRLNYERWFNAFMRIRFRHFRDAVDKARNAR